MPIYEYQCAGCNHHFDVIQKINDEPIKTCPQCAKDQVIRLVSAAGFQLKGSGWYATDFKTKGTAPKDTADKKDDSSKARDTAAKDNPPATSTAKSTKGDSE